MKRFYRKVEVAETAGGFEVLLDGRPVRTPARASMALPNRALAEAIAEEWREQGEEIKPLAMPLTRLAATSIDRVSENRQDAIEEILGYAGTDLVCYRAEQPASLVSRQNAEWQPLLDWATLRYDAPLLVTTGVIPRPQPDTSLTALRAVVAGLDSMALTALHAATISCGSLIIALALMEGRLDAAGAWDASQLDESYQIETWGEDAEAAARRAALRRDIDATARFMAQLRS